MNKITSLFKMYETFQNFPSEFVTSTFCLDFLGRLPFYVKSRARRLFFFVIFASLNAPHFENWGRTPASILYSSVPRDVNKYLDDTFAITSPDLIPHGFVKFIILKVIHREKICEISGIQQRF